MSLITIHLIMTRKTYEENRRMYGVFGERERENSCSSNLYYPNRLSPQLQKCTVTKLTFQLHRSQV